MASFRDWFWQLEAAGLGPDHFLQARFQPRSSERLLTAAREFMPTGFVLEPDGLTEAQPSGGQQFVDRRTFDALQIEQETGVRNNMYITSSIEVRDQSLSLENTYARHEIGETAFLIAVFQSEHLQVQDWRVFAGGDGYDSIEVARGEDAASFFGYIKFENR